MFVSYQLSFFHPSVKNRLWIQSAKSAFSPKSARQVLTFVKYKTIKRLSSQHRKRRVNNMQKVINFCIIVYITEVACAHLISQFKPESVSSHQVQCNIPTFEALLRKHVYLAVSWTMQKVEQRSLCLRALMQSDGLYSSSVFEHYNRILLCDWVPWR